MIQTYVFFLPADRSALRLQQGASGASGASQRVYGSRVQSGLPPGAMRLHGDGRKMEKWWKSKIWNQRCEKKYWIYWIYENCHLKETGKSQVLHLEISQQSGNCCFLSKVQEIKHTNLCFTPQKRILGSILEALSHQHSFEESVMRRFRGTTWSETMYSVSGFLNVDFAAARAQVA